MCKAQCAWVSGDVFVCVCVCVCVSFAVNTPTVFLSEHRVKTTDRGRQCIQLNTADDTGMRVSRALVGRHGHVSPF